MNLTGSKQLSISVDAVNEDESTLALTVLLRSCSVCSTLLCEEDL